MFPQVGRPGTLEQVITALQAVLEFFKTYKTPDSWHHVTSYQTTWSDSEPVLFRKDPFPMRRVFLRGSAARSGGAVGNVFTLPLKYRPPTLRLFTCPITGGGSALVQVRADGVVLYSGAAGAVVVALDSISFDTDE